MFMKCLSTSLLALLCLGLPVSAQVTGERFVDVYVGASPAKRMSLTPASANVLFPSSRVFLDKEDVTADLAAVDSAVFRNVQFVRARDYPLQETGKAHDHRANVAAITAVAYKDKLYVVNELFCGENIAVINGLLGSLGARVDSPEKALQIANFYLQLGYYSFDKPDKFVVSAFAQLPPKQVEFPSQNLTENRNVIHPPVVTKDGNTYKVDMVTNDTRAAFVLLHHWSVSIVDSQIISEHEEVVVPQRLHYRVGEAPSDRFGGTLASPMSNLRFQPAFIADGNTPDSKGFNVATYGFNTSDGPPVNRTAYYFNSPERATNEMHNQLDQAVQILEQGKWINEKGEVLGERALVLYSSDGGAVLSAAVLLKGNTNFFEVSSASLRNLLEFERVWFHPDVEAK